MIINCRCGTPLEVDEDMIGEEIQCPRCQTTMVASAPGAPAQPSKRGEFTASPPRQPTQQPLSPQPAPLSAPQVAPGTTSANATACLNMGINSFVIPFVPALCSILFGLLALRDCRKYRMQGKAVAVMGMTLSVLSSLLMGSVVYMFYPTLKQAYQMINGLGGKDGGDITKMLPNGAGGMDGAGQINNPETKADSIYAQGMLKFGVGDLQTQPRLRQITDMNRLNRIEKALSTAKNWKELLDTP